MFQDDPEEVEALEQRLVAVLNRESPRSMDVIHALVNILTLAIATVACPDCRKAIARELTKAVPEMLETADQMAAEAEEAGFAPVERHLH